MADCGAHSFQFDVRSSSRFSVKMLIDRLRHSYFFRPGLGETSRSCSPCGDAPSPQNLLQPEYADRRCFMLSVELRMVILSDIIRSSLAAQRTLSFIDYALWSWTSRKQLRRLGELYRNEEKIKDVADLIEKDEVGFGGMDSIIWCVAF